MSERSERSEWSESGAEERRRIRRTTWLWVGGALGAVALVVGGTIGYFVISGTPMIMDEWTCSDGEAPYFFAEGGSACAPTGSTLPADATWDPLGNRPFECDDRWGWRKVEQSATGDLDCLKDGLGLPQGWRVVD